MSDACCGPSPKSPEDPGYSGDPVASVEDSPWWADRDVILPLISGVLWILGTIIHVSTGTDGQVSGVIVTLLFSAGLLAGAATFVPGALTRLFREQGRQRLGVALLMTIAAVGATALGHVGEAAALAFLFSLSEMLEDRAMDRAKGTLRALLEVIPNEARVERTPESVAMVPVTELQCGDLLLLGAGERLATDGVVIEGRSGVDTSAVTGESIPVPVGPGDSICAGAVNTASTLKVRAVADGRDNSLTRIVELVEQAQAHRGKRARLADRIARPLVPIVLVVAILIGLIGCLFGDSEVWLDRSLVVLVAASPCALAIAVPVTVISAVGAASKFGIVVTSGAAFEQLGTVKTVALDKTGTLTANKPKVVEIRSVGGRDENQILGLAAAVEASSSHPLASAILRAAEERGPAQ